MLKFRILICSLFFSVCGATFAQAEAIKVFAAASLKGALEELAQGWNSDDAKGRATFIYAGSSTLAKQIEAAAPADIFISADTDWMDDVEKKNLLELQTRFNFTGNTLVVVAPSGTKALSAIIDLPMQLADGKLAVGDIKSVPAGKYAKAALTSLGIWGSVEKHLVQTENVRAALQLVVLGEAKFGIVYASDAKSEPKVQGVFAFPKNSHPQIIYPAAAIAGHASPDVLSFLAYLKTDKAREIMRKRGFAN